MRRLKIRRSGPRSSWTRQSKLAFALSLGVLSKAYGLPGLRLGWIACKDRELLQRLERYKHFLSICNPVPSERLAVIALKARDRILTRNRDLANQNAAKLDETNAAGPVVE